jgi:DNA-binding transcriptional LysR family regulator
VDIRSVDLNLLVIFDAMARHRSVNRTAEAVGLSQPATSAALARLRALFDDALFVRAGAQMEPTPRALELAPAVHRWWRPSPRHPAAVGFDPATRERTFTILTPDIGEVAFMPGVLRRLRRRRRTSPADHRQAAQGGGGSAGVRQADLAVGFFPDLHKAGFFQQALFQTSYACIACGAQRGGRARMTLKQYLAAQAHRGAAGRARAHAGPLPGRQGLPAPRDAGAVALHEPAGAAARQRPGRDRAAGHRHRAGAHIALRRIDMPFKPPQIDLQQFWHRRMHDDAGQPCGCAGCSMR